MELYTHTHTHTHTSHKAPTLIKRRAELVQRDVSGVNFESR